MTDIKLLLLLCYVLLHKTVDYDIINSRKNQDGSLQYDINMDSIEFVSPINLAQRREFTKYC